MSNDKSNISFQDRVVIITGSGGGLGRHYALEYAKRGARVVVNDLGGTLGGSTAGSTKAADVVVEEIVKSGGQAVANYDNIVTNPDGILKSAIDKWGRVDILINNAGILKDSSFKKMTEDQFKAVLDVHLTGAFKLTQLCWKYFKDQKFGRVVMTASPAGLYGNFGQANYSAAKLACVGFGETLAKEGFKYNIKVNTIAPLAKSRMTETILPPDVLERLSPAKIAPLVLYLTSDKVESTGAIYEVAAGFYAQIRWERSGGLYLNPQSLTPELIVENFKSIMDFNRPGIEHPIQLKDYNKVWDKTKQLPKTESKLKLESLKGKVVIITGAGGGLGRSHAKLFAKYGAKVVVNDFADPFTVVKEIESEGGLAIGVKGDVFAQAEEIVQAAVKAYGTVDVLVNNAGILRDRSFLKMSYAEWDSVLNIHLLAAFRMCKLVWPIMSEKGGWIINTTSTSGIYGNFGQANYASAKAGVLALSRTLAKEGKKAGINVLAYAPHAETAMTKTIFSESDMNKFDVSQVSPFVVAVVSKEMPFNVSGELFEVGAGWIGNVRWQRAKGVVNHTDDETSVEFVRDNWSDITDFTQSVTISSAEESSMAILAAVGGDEDEDDDDEDDEDEVDEPYVYDHRQVILYNLSIGATAKDLRYTYESDEHFGPFATFGVIPPLASGGGLDFDDVLTDYNPMKLLHGEQYLHLNSAIPTSGKLTTKAHPLAVVTKSKGSKSNVLIKVAYETFDENNKLIFTNVGSYFVRDTKSKSDSFNKELDSKLGNYYRANVTYPQRKFDHQLEFKTSVDQAALYRLNADFNPLHIDPNFAKGGGFDKPILHGLCSFGISGFLLSKVFGDSLVDIKGRFVGVVYPGETIVVDMWKENGEVIWKAWVKERKAEVIGFASAKFAQKESKL